jgi:pyruvate ferredoxin oxidoreductase beta subunit
MAINLKQLSKKPDLLAGGHRACAGCAGPTVIRQVLLAAENPVVCSCATGCMEVSTTIYPYTAWRVPFIHCAFENSAATMSGVEAAYRALKAQGKIDREINFIAFGGDGGTYDIGFQSLSGAMERGHKMLYVCYDNGAYMNTGIQRSSATPMGAATSTSPNGSVKHGKEGHRKDLTACIAAHNIPYVAQASPHNPRDLITKVQKALAVDGPAFMNILAPCHRGWRCKMEDSISIAKLGVDTCYWPLFEVENGAWKLNYKPKEKVPLVEWLKPQGRFKHLFAPGNEQTLEKLQGEVDRRWNALLAKDAAGSN